MNNTNLGTDAEGYVSWITPSGEHRREKCATWHGYHREKKRFERTGSEESRKWMNNYAEMMETGTQGIYWISQDWE